jgi:CheY-like chemotaxis protein
MNSTASSCSRSKWCAGMRRGDLHRAKDSPVVQIVEVPSRNRDSIRIAPARFVRDVPALVESTNEPTILVLEDEENDLFFLRRALATCNFKGRLRVVQTMSQARDYLEGRGTYADRDYYPLPDLIVTDFKMKGPTGVEFLRWLQSEKVYAQIPVVMFSGTALPQDKAAALESGALAFFAKSGDFRTVCQSVEGILKYLPQRKK